VGGLGLLATIGLVISVVLTQAEALAGYRRLARERAYDTYSKNKEIKIFQSIQLCCAASEVEVRGAPRRGTCTMHLCTVYLLGCSSARPSGR
jgi:hypothetical protein